ncbi:right-handed parallel beta-helix repeat-containing protein [Acidipropionibacterium jensenii]|uniref:right-handed parallel beta-helix repeat-containing protein n=1 Tax=Acidipropionibacterium jensenii TaxID=1749 RepID=UPI001386BE95|nr:right-handed parallel beta-helix repeat-containing protein [Acidipropionibacterium jensenii]
MDHEPVPDVARVRLALEAGGFVDLSRVPALRLTEPLRITRPTVIIGGDLTAPEGAAALEVTSSQVQIVGARIRGSATRGSTRDPGQILVHAHGCRESSVVGCTVDHVLYAGVMCLPCCQVLVADNEISDIPLTPGTVDGYGIAFSDAGNTEAARSRNCRAVRNTIRIVDREGIDTHGGLAIRITDNVIVGCARGIAVVSGNQTRRMSPQQCLVARNRIGAAGARTAPLEAVAFRGIEGTRPPGPSGTTWSTAIAGRTRSGRPPGHGPGAPSRVSAAWGSAGAEGRSSSADGP